MVGPRSPTKAGMEFPTTCSTELVTLPENSGERESRSKVRKEEIVREKERKNIKVEKGGYTLKFRRLNDKLDSRGDKVNSC